MRYEILGRLRLWTGTEHIEIAARKPGIILATLLICENQVVSADRLVFELWAGRPPRRTMATLHVYISQLRKLLRRGADTANPIVTTPAGYRLELGTDELDLHDFQRYARDGNAALRAGRHEDAVAEFDRALAECSGPGLEDLRDSPTVNHFATGLEESRLTCLEHRVACLLELGRHREAIGDLANLVTQHPLHEEFHRSLMLALYRSGRRADALRTFQDTRRILTTELGLEPSRSMREIQRSILASDEYAPEPIR